jgi:hypothetical protein
MSAARKLREGSLVLKGATVADLLIEQPTKLQLVIDGTDSPSHRVDDPPIDSHRAMSETAASDAWKVAAPIHMGIMHSRYERSFSSPRAAGSFA